MANNANDLTLDYFDSEYFKKYYQCKDSIDFIYYHLGIIDSKASVLMRVNAILFAVLCLFLPRWSDQQISIGIPYFFWICAISAVLLFISTVLSLSVVRLHWFSSRDFVERPGGQGGVSTYSVGDMNKEYEVLNSRTRRYRLSWILCLAALIFLMLVLINGLSSLAEIEGVGWPFNGKDDASGHVVG